MEDIFRLIEDIQKYNQITTLGHKSLTNKIQKKQKYRYELMLYTEFQTWRRFVRNDLVERKIKSCGQASKNFLELKESQDKTLTKLLEVNRIL